MEVKTSLHAGAGSAGGGNSSVVIDPAAAAMGSDKNGAGQADICGVYRGDGVGGIGGTGGTGGKLRPVGMPSLPGWASIPLRGCLGQHALNLRLVGSLPKRQHDRRCSLVSQSCHAF